MSNQPISGMSNFSNDGDQMGNNIANIAVNSNQKISASGLRNQEE